MGKKNKGKWKDKKNKKKQRTEEGDSKHWRTLGIEERKNLKWEAYYKAQNIVPEDQWDAFEDAFKQPLPISFRLTTSAGAHHRIIQKFEDGEFGGPEKVYEADGRKFGPPTPIPWYPNKCGWTLDISKKDIRKVQELQDFRKFLMEETDQGNISRQEAVSMLPPLLLDVQPDHIVLDMCAAPGSKTAQILEAIHGGDLTATPPGMVVANDADEKRAYMLVHQLKRFTSPCFLVTTHAGQFFPTLFVKPKTGDATGEQAEEEVGEEEQTGQDGQQIPRQDRQVQKFDRILCDVPCSGDGTFRKNPNLWLSWDPHFGIGLHCLQLSIAIRGLQMLKVGGLMVYSTCALNPVEDEAVVAQLLRGGEGALELVDVSEKLPGLVRLPGINTWKFQDKGEKGQDGEMGKWYDSFDDVPGRRRRIVHKSMFPPTEEEQKWMHLDRSFRILPHTMNTGGFYIAVFRKLKPCPRTFTVASAAGAQDSVDADSGAADGKNGGDENTTAAPAVEQEVKPKTDERRKKKPNGRTVFQEDPFIPVASSIFDSLKSFYGMDDSFNREHFFGRSELGRKVYRLNEGVSNIVINPHNHKLKVVHTGVRCFESRHEVAKALAEQAEREAKETAGEAVPTPQHVYRVCQEGVYHIRGMMTKQVLKCSPAQIGHLLSTGCTKFEDLRQSDSPMLQDLMAKIEKTQDGCVVAITEPEEATQAADTELIKSPSMCLWRTDKSITLMLSNEDKHFYAQILGVPEPPPVVQRPPNSNKNRKLAEAAAAAEATS